MGNEVQQTTAADNTATAENPASPFAPGATEDKSPGGSAVTSPATAADNTATADNKGDAILTPLRQEGCGGQASQTSPTGQTDQNGEQDTAILVPEADGGKEQGTQEAPEQYEEFRMPEGFVLEGETKEKVTGLFRELNLSQESAQKLIDYATERDLAGREAMLNELAAKRKEWRSSLRARPNFEADLALARKGMKALVRTPEGAELFNDSWMSDHPAVFDIFVRAGRLVAEDTFDNQNGGSAEENVNLRRFPVK